MKKVILSLLLVGLTFLGFSNASLFGEVEQTYDFEYINGYGYYIQNPTFTTFGCSGNGKVSGTLNAGNIRGTHYELNCPGYLSYFKNGDEELQIDSIRYIYKESGNPIIYTLSSSTPNIILSPAVSGFKTVLLEVVPFVVFISVGLLLVTIGFIAVRWLVNRLGNKFNSVFSSKRD